MSRAGNWRPLASREQLERRARTLDRVRSFLSGRGVLEVTTPTLTRHGVSDVHIHSVELPAHGFLRTSPEYCHKRLLAAGTGDLFEIGPVFRNGESGKHHRLEFTMLEWYRVGWDWERLATETLDLIRATDPDRAWKSETISWRELSLRHLGRDLMIASSAELRAQSSSMPDDLERSGMLDWLFSFRIQPNLPSSTLTVVHDFPPEQAALARIRPGPVPVAERFEVFAGSVELANGYQELTDADEQARRFAEDNRRRRAAGQREMPSDPWLLQALEAGLPDCAGVALGIDRLLMVLADTDDLAGTAAFDGP